MVCELYPSKAVKKKKARIQDHFSELKDMSFQTKTAGQVATQWVRTRPHQSLPS